ncbi:TetR/AcrR family transcriptional regulator [Bacillus toyonensis]|uniref:TetR/AcrR family transcriptional regulator n=1 Tax=Bacillus toyonensis TaxID=155322 RepID=UPI000BEFD4CF|nr:TetR/AcrR family transcriptional regulator [Bacillus toyonensis]PEJ56461.1 TetR family transcriptional regulator [Bacillus toyonensis]PEN71410.1 TetR family transcriptional regulator [Bacillus toyonensis]PGB25726.1 TetR family transcriptional regulator [Bacillus toyonensis]PGE20287.1 TetR family transcriptional regulator [Bacillus toyonensis]
MSTRITRQKILSAASQIVQYKGVAKLTLEAVAKEAGVSKGGLLYHFSNKEALIEGMILKGTEEYQDAIYNKVEEDSERKGRWVRSFVEERLSNERRSEELSSSMMTALMLKPELLEPLQQTFHQLQNKIENDEIDSVCATIIRLAADGLWYSECLGIGRLSPELREKVIQALINNSYK